jgi:hypothetical protein
MATKTVVYKKQKIILDDSNALGTGGEATVILYGNEALKIYHQPSKKREQKLKDFIKLDITLPNNVAGPIDLVYDTNSNVIGFAMHVAKKCKEAIQLSNKKIRLKDQITSNNIITFFEHMKLTLESIHSSNLIVGDFNDLNVLYNNKFLSVFIDVDSFQFGKYPCPVGTDQYIDPVLYGIDLSVKSCFSKETDWYSFAVMLFKSLLWSHPYGGTHDKYASLIERAKHKITVFDQGVIYPRIALKPETISQELLDYFHNIFKLGKRTELSLDILRSHANSFEKCSKCNYYYHKSRGRCPICFITTVQPSVNVSQIIVSHNIDSDKCVSESIYVSEGTILFSRVLIDKRIIIIEYIKDQTFLRIFHETGNQVLNFKLWDSYVRDVKYDFFKDYLVIGVGDDIMVFQTVVSDNLKPVAKTTSMKFDGTLMFGCSSDNLYRLTDQTLLCSEIVNNNVVDTVITSTLQNQTWFEVGDSGLGLSYFRIFEQYYYFVFSKKGRYEVNIPKLKGKLIETVVEVSENTILLLQKTLFNGRTYSHYYIIDDTGKILESKTEESLSSELLKNLQGKFLLGTSIVHPSDAGVVIERQQQLTLKKETAKYIDSSDALFIYKDGILVISDHDIKFLRLIK